MRSRPGVRSMFTSSGCTAGSGATTTSAASVSYTLTGTYWGCMRCSVARVASVTRSCWEVSGAMDARYPAGRVLSRWAASAAILAPSDPDHARRWPTLAMLTVGGEDLHTA
jgi:hypothetical protein